MTQQPIAVDQRANDLVLAVLPATETIELTPLLQQHHHHTGWSMIFSIIGESHWVQISHPSHPGLQEVLACVALSSANLQHAHAFTDLATHRYRCGAYQTAVEFDHQPTWDLPDAACPSLTYAFPKMYGQVPRTTIHWQQTDSTLTWWTLHTYIAAQDVTYVHTRSQYKFA